MTRAKFVVDSVELNGDDHKTIKMSACTTEEGDSLDYTKYTPWGNLEFGVTDKTKAFDIFNVGDIFHLDMTKIGKE